MVNKETTHLELVRTISSVVTAICLIVITVEMMVAGVYATKAIQNLHSTYHPEKLGSIIGDASDIIQTLHKTTHTLKSGHKIAIFDEIDKLAVGIQMLSNSLDNVNIDNAVAEAVAWRNMSVQAVLKLKNTFINL
jgi:hypothetical protein